MKKKREGILVFSAIGTEAYAAHRPEVDAAVKAVNVLVPRGGGKKKNVEA